MVHIDRSSRSKRRERRVSDDDTQSISLSEYHGSYTVPQTYSQDGLDTLPQAMYQQLPWGQSYQQSGQCYPEADESACYPTTDPASGLAVFDGYAPSTMSSTSSVPVSDVWDLQSSGTLSSAATTAPPRYNRNNVDFHIHVQPAATQRYELPCEIRGCGFVYPGDEEVEWIRHTEEHLGGAFPSKLRCWFNCDFGLFDAKSPEVGGDTRNNFERRMRHIRDHILYDGFRPHERVPDGFLIEHCRTQGIIDRQACHDWLKPARVPSILGTSRSGSESNEYGSSRHHHHRSSGHANLTVVEEEAGPSRARDRRYEKSDKKEHKRDSHNRKMSTK